ncbi:hypothetical protein ACSFA8_19630 [Variovorax sp. RT4R15]|uniref:hypothetical protein n=1 Tax=Variovorax sp. RT4R15 TaxID=3443737 RepID=UPI003F456E8B
MSEYAVRSAKHFPTPFLQRSLPSRPCAPALFQASGVRQYREMENAFRASGGIVSSDEVVTLLIRHTDQPISQLARWIVDHDVLSFRWESRTMLPLFQFDLSSMTIRPSVTAVIGELVPALGDWDVSIWFAHSNAWLAGTAPVDVLERDLRSVIDAARAERYLLCG